MVERIGVGDRTRASSGVSRIVLKREQKWDFGEKEGAKRTNHVSYQSQGGQDRCKG